ncbi:hypothetical protein [Clostridium sp. D53t1_180928_C8]|uniref:hypothetical protein n=1 Tax=Clostridium sp. D53t1_180928_C8 TaxID=2787101 RepID=UPI0018A9442C|nr:hypothetical protein [Clostridium sp. D53t1_180928_C8]
MNINKKFRKIVINLKRNYNGVSLKKCNDNYVGFFEYENGIVKEKLWFCKHLRNINKDKVKITKANLVNIKNQYEKIIVIVLESPHIDEFNKNKFSVAPAPALGSTGCKLDKYFCEVINECFKKYDIEKGKYHVILSNAIQYQCSLGTDTEVFRDRVWLKLWLSRNLKSEFIKRLQIYEPDIIVNLCTKGSHEKDSLSLGQKSINNIYLKSICDKKRAYEKIEKIKNTTLRKLTQKAINKYSENRKIKCFYGNHPSSWFNKRNRWIKRV